LPRARRQRCERLLSAGRPLVVRQSDADLEERLTSAVHAQIDPAAVRVADAQLDPRVVRVAGLGAALTQREDDRVLELDRSWRW
jgi:hypothetical protein